LNRQAREAWAEQASAAELERIFSMSEGLVASTRTPGITAPDTSRTTPAIWPSCAKAVGTKNEELKN
jgi:hypothetical protein